MPVTETFKEGDTVYMKEEYRGGFSSDFYGPLTVRSLEGAWIRVVGKEFYSFREFFAYRFEKRNGRVEGDEISRENIRIGDTIRFEYTYENVKVTREGKVDSVLEGQSFYAEGGLKIDNVPMTAPAGLGTFTLVEAVQEVDELLERVEAAETGQIVEIPWQVGRGHSIARKDSETCWGVYTGSGREYESDTEFADRIRGVENVKWLSR